MQIAFCSMRALRFCSEVYRNKERTSSHYQSGNSISIQESIVAAFLHGANVLYTILCKRSRAACYFLICSRVLQCSIDHSVCRNKYCNFYMNQIAFLSQSRTFRTSHIFNTSSVMLNSKDPPGVRRVLPAEFHHCYYYCYFNVVVFLTDRFFYSLHLFSDF